ncbi:hypothetical protein FRC04_003975 [Tulasnella sp. 424]|nr:hypothetical protein FRC04_003975 [Tulasnella sp. 424]KAG8965425.1 hypothetical protein FRC05_003262 [Tulasnella sp. 425]
MPLFNHKENRDITATSPATNRAYEADGNTGYQTGANAGARNDIYDPAYDNTRSTGTFGNRDHHGTYGTAGYDTAAADAAYANQPGALNRTGGTTGMTGDHTTRTAGAGVGTAGATGNRLDPANDNYNDSTFGHQRGVHNGTAGAGVGTAGATGNRLDPANDNYNDNVFGNQRGVHNQSVQPNTGNNLGAGTNTNTNQGVGGGPWSAGGQQTSAFPTDREARHLERSGKIEKAVGTMLCSTTMKQRGLEKQAQGANIAMQSQQLAQAENLEAQAKAMRGHAVGMGAHPTHLNPAGQQGTNTTGQYSGTY